MKRFNDSIIPFETHGRLSRDFIEQEMSHHQMYFNEYFGNIKVDLFQNFKVIRISEGWYSYVFSGK